MPDIDSVTEGDAAVLREMDEIEQRKSERQAARAKYWRRVEVAAVRLYPSYRETNGKEDAAEMAVEDARVLVDELDRRRAAEWERR